MGNMGKSRMERQTQQLPRAKAGPAAPLPGQVVQGRYRIERLLGQGGMGAVYAAEHVPSQKPLALKILLPEFSRRPELVARFQREAQAASLLDHAHIVDVLDLGSLPDGTLFLVMDRVEGRSVADLVEEGPLGVRRSLVLARQALDAIAYAHERGIIHRDLKPENLMVTLAGTENSPYEQLKVLDFGLVKVIGEAAEELAVHNLTQTGSVFGTPGYMAPEQALGRRVDRRVDLYAVGVILFEMLTGTALFASSDVLELMRLHVTEPAPLLSSRAGSAPWCTAEMERLVARALAKTPDERYSSGQEMIEALELAFRSIDHLPP
jgi:eukaryotic-like serine/threonine-protein kinase